MESSNCPLPNTHSRLNQVHRLWHQTLATYDDPEGFRANLNSTIEALRNVTFMLQAEKEQIEGFEDWYASWVDRMKANEVLNWLQAARTTVVHRADLDTSSQAVGRLHNNLTLMTITAEVAPALSTAAICHEMLKDLPPEIAAQKKDLVISVERRWVVADLPDSELLDALARAYEFLSELLQDAHSKCGYEFYGVDDEGHAVPQERHRPECMVTTQESRTVRMSADDGRLLVPGRVEVPGIDAAKGAELARRYGFTTDSPKDSNPEPAAFAEQMVRWSKQVMARDKRHDRIVFLRGRDGWQIQQLMAVDRPEKYALVRVLAEEIRRAGADVLVDVGEVWLAPAEDLASGSRPENWRHRAEGLQVTLFQSDGTCRTYTTRFKRGLFGRISFEETELADGSVPTYLAPICEVWGLPAPEGG